MTNTTVSETVSPQALLPSCGSVAGGHVAAVLRQCCGRVAAGLLWGRSPESQVYSSTRAVDVPSI